jgi:hypothetical protein
VWIETTMTVQPNLLKIRIPHSLVAIANKQGHRLVVWETEEKGERTAIRWEILTDELYLVGGENLLLERFGDMSDICDEQRSHQQTEGSEHPFDTLPHSTL